MVLRGFLPALASQTEAIEAVKMRITQDAMTSLPQYVSGDDPVGHLEDSCM